jgi:hypothetical protein
MWTLSGCSDSMFWFLRQFRRFSLSEISLQDRKTTTNLVIVIINKRLIPDCRHRNKCSCRLRAPRGASEGWSGILGGYLLLRRWGSAEGRCGWLAVTCERDFIGKTAFRAPRIGRNHAVVRDTHGDVGNGACFSTEASCSQIEGVPPRRDFLIGLGKILT